MSPARLPRWLAQALALALVLALALALVLALALALVLALALARALALVLARGAWLQRGEHTRRWGEATRRRTSPHRRPPKSAESWSP